MITYFAADYVFPIHCPPIKNGVVAINKEKEIIGVYSLDDELLNNKEIKRYKGIITPGFINTHCHLELSHLHKKIKANTGLVSFLQQIMNKPPSVYEEVERAMEEADRAMFEAGIVAVGDIANTSISKKVKLKSKLYYHTFAELFCLEPEKAKDVFKKGVELCETFSPLPVSVTPHAPYSVCKDLFKYIKSFCNDTKNLITIHNQESDEENKLYRYKTGEFLSFYKKINRNIDFFKPQARNSIRSIIPLLPQKERILLVHNTYTTYKDINFVERYESNAFWCLCPNANLYIEGRLPKVNIFLQSRNPIVLGTDSLASNDKLSILAEIKTLHHHFPDLDLNQSLTWATLNGAKYLGIDERYGSLEIGKTPGINLINNTVGMEITSNSIVQKLA